MVSHFWVAREHEGRGQEGEVGQRRAPLSSSEVISLIDTCMDLLKDNNFRIRKARFRPRLFLHPLRNHFIALLPTVVDRLANAK
ncbi:hypothetical protein VNO78_04863 [Psophocarpus tetragonolobus]|uniref:Uncharacterized protein n=1 Tax=Psophocarpus tetragonolobus TaxID=3891 RepID=A0AAN9T2W8_PSOTE